MEKRRKVLITYEKFIADNPTWWSTTFEGFDSFKLSTLQGIVYNWFRYRKLCCYDVNKFKVYFERAIREIWDRWCELTNLEDLRASQDIFDKLFVTNSRDLTTQETNGNTGGYTKDNTGTQDDVTTHNTTDTLGKIESTSNRGTTTTQDGDIRETTNTGTQDIDNTGTQKTTHTGTQDIDNTGTEDTAHTGTDTVDREVTEDLKDDQNYLNAFNSSTEESDTPTDAGHSSATSKAQDTTTYNSNETRTDNLSETRTDNLEDERTDNLNQKRTDDLKQTTHDNRTTTVTDNTDVTVNDNQTAHKTGTDSIRRTDALKETNTNYDNGYRNIGEHEEGRNGKSPMEIIDEAIKVILRFCSTQWVITELQPCFLLIVDDFDDDWEEVEPNEY